MEAPTLGFHAAFPIVRLTIRELVFGVCVDGTPLLALAVRVGRCRQGRACSICDDRS